MFPFVCKKGGIVDWVVTSQVFAVSLVGTQRLRHLRNLGARLGSRSPSHIRNSTVIRLLLHDWATVIGLFHVFISTHCTYG